ncbi:MarR family transcriptional regulator [Altererythrobacter sp. BO-6]|uniref:MarR family winged helix-turn-helix transcriptional regulator n=1 Tax=Altererythrobacter sp. BO-6 TaxID=2604537 RepID=UPI0013E185CD|nr:MarR family transcriptional regulator [Altererythrobacter sp. BO-6]QIG53246.1 MarR family transcriptional regulator [Altererythrobacter sp. BO-6]
MLRKWLLLSPAKRPLTCKEWGHRVQIRWPFLLRAAESGLMISDLGLRLTAPMLRVLHELHLSHSKLFQSLDRVLRRTEGITTAHQVIMFVLSFEDDLPSSEVARRTGHSKSRLTGLVNTLEELGMVVRGASSSDGRVSILSLTEEGRQLVARTKEGPREINQRILAPFSEQEQQVIARFLRQVRDIASSIETKR